MSYTKHTWVTDEYITADKLNNIENGIEESANNRLVINMEQVSDSVLALDKNYNEISTAIENGAFPFVLYNNTFSSSTQLMTIVGYWAIDGEYYIQVEDLDFVSDSATGILTCTYSENDR